MDESLRGYWDYCGLNLLFVSRLLEERLESRLATYGVTLREFMVLRLIADDAFIKQKELDLYVGHFHEPIRNTLDSLESKLLINREHKRRCGKRVSLADVTESGIALLKKADTILRRQEEIFLGHLPRATRVGVNSTLENVLKKTLTH